MESNKTLERILLCVGTIFLFVGLWSFIDLSFINEYMVLVIATIFSIGLYFVAAKDFFCSKLISNVFATISVGLAMTSLWLFTSTFDVESLD